MIGWLALLRERETLYIFHIAQRISVQVRIVVRFRAHRRGATIVGARVRTVADRVPKNLFTELPLDRTPLA